LLVVGQESSGKTQLIEALHLIEQHGPKRYVDHLSESPTPTVGISVTNRDARVGDRNVSMMIWDFAGSEMYHTAHSFFITERSVYFVVWNITSSFVHSGTTDWLQMISLLAPESPIIFLATHQDLASSKMKQAFVSFQEHLLAKQKYPNLIGCFLVSILTGNGMDKLYKCLVDTITGLKYLDAKQPQPFLDFEKNLLGLAEERRATVPLVQFSTCLSIAEKSGVQVNTKPIIRILQIMELMGTVLYFPGKEFDRETQKGSIRVLNGNFDGIIILDPKWILEFFEMVISIQRQAPNGTGIVSVQSIKQKLFRLPSHLHAYVLSLLNKFDFGFELDPQNVLIPSLLPPTNPNLQSQWAAYDPTKLQFTRYYRFNFIPFGLFHKFMVRLFKLPVDRVYWSTGILLTEQIPNPSSCLINLIRTDHIISISTRGPTEGNGGAKLFCSIIEFLDGLLSMQFKVTKYKVEIPCCLCIAAQLRHPTVFTKEACEKALVSNELTMNCDLGHSFLLHGIAPDVTMSDFNSKMIEMTAVETKEKIGEGAFASVFKGSFKNQDVAVKILNLPEEEDRRGPIVREFRREVRIMTRISHVNLVHLYGFSVGTQMGLVMDWCQEGNLYEFLHNDKKELDWKLRLRISLDIATGMNYLHSLNPPLLHRDLKSPNILLLSSDYRSVCGKVADFGLTREMLASSFGGTKRADRDVVNPTWLAPEVLRELPFGLASDVYPFGVILYEIYSRQHPFEMDFLSEVEDAVLSGQRPPIQDDCPASFRVLTAKCWADTPFARPSFSRIVVNLGEIILEMFPDESAAFYHNGKEMHLGLGTHLDRTLRPSKTVVVIESDTQFEFKKGTKKQLMERFRNNVAPTIKDVRGNKKNLLKKISEFKQLYIFSFPEDPQLLSSFINSTMEQEGFTAYKIFNLSRERYDYTVFDGLVVEYPIDIDAPSSLDDICTIVSEARAWMDTPGNAALIHCNGTACRTGSIVSALLMKNGKSIAEALNYFEHLTQQPVCSPGYLRYLNYYSQSLSARFKVVMPTLVLHKIRFSSIPSFSRTGSCDPFYCVRHGGKKIIFAKKLKGKKDRDTADFFTRNISVTGDVKIEFYHKNASNKMLSLSLNTMFLKFDSQNRVILAKHELDHAYLDKEKKHFRSNFQIEVYFLYPEHIAPRRPESRMVGDAKVQDALNDPNFAKDIICDICKKVIYVEKGERCLQPTVGSFIHVNCMKCCNCGISLVNYSGPTTVIGKKIRCGNCDTSIVSKCAKCEQVIDENLVAIGNKTFHDNCLCCAICSKVTAPAQCKFLPTDEIVCISCSTTKPKEQITEKPSTAAFPHMTELQEIIDNPVQKKHFLAFLGADGQQLVEMFCAIKEVETLQEVRLALHQTCTKTKEAPLTKAFLEQLHHQKAQKPDLMGSFSNFVDTIYTIVTKLLSPYVPQFNESPQYKDCLEEEAEEPDSDEEQDELRRREVEDIIPIVATDRPAVDPFQRREMFLSRNFQKRELAADEDLRKAREALARERTLKFEREKTVKEEQEKGEKEREEKEKSEKERIEKEKLEQELAEKLEKERLERLEIEAQAAVAAAAVAAAEKARMEQERLEFERAERLEAMERERALERERIQRIEAEKAAAREAEAARLRLIQSSPLPLLRTQSTEVPHKPAFKVPIPRIVSVPLMMDPQMLAKSESERLKRERLEMARAQAQDKERMDKIEKEREAQRKADEDRNLREQQMAIERERQIRLQKEKDLALEKQRLEKMEIERERREREKLNRERAIREQVSRNKTASSPSITYTPSVPRPINTMPPGDGRFQTTPMSMASSPPNSGHISPNPSPGGTPPARPIRPSKHLPQGPTRSQSVSAVPTSSNQTGRISPNTPRVNQNPNPITGAPRINSPQGGVAPKPTSEVQHGDCFLCKQHIVGRCTEVMGSDGITPKKLHPACHVCVVCHASLTGCKYIFDDGVFWCVNDYDNEKSTRCGHCHQSLVGTRFVKALNRCWHFECFKCGNCRMVIGPDPYWENLDTKTVLCKNCLEAAPVDVKNVVL